MRLILKYFPDISPLQQERFSRLEQILPELNRGINVISRRDIVHLEERHILHSLAIARLVRFGQGQTVLDAGTGGGFPGIPLAIMFPATRFILADSIAKKIRLVERICKDLQLTNAVPRRSRVESLNMEADVVVSRAVAPMPRITGWTEHCLRPPGEGLPSGWVALKGGDLRSELQPFGDKVELHPVSQWFEEPFFSAKTVVYLKK